MIRELGRGDEGIARAPPFPDTTPPDLVVPAVPDRVRERRPHDGSQTQLEVPIALPLIHGLGLHRSIGPKPGT